MNDEKLKRIIIEFFTNNPTLWNSQPNGDTISETEVVNTLNSTIAVGFLMIWSVFESKLTNGSMFAFNDIQMYSSDILSKSNGKININEEVEHFIERYTTNDNHTNFSRNLFYGRQKEIDRFNDLLVEAKSPLRDIQIMFIVVYRFRNNMFHGNKKIDTWLNYKEQIYYCITFMVKVLGY